MTYSIRRRWDRGVNRLGLVSKASNYFVQASCGRAVTGCEKHHAAPFERGGSLPDEVDTSLQLGLGEHWRKSLVR